MNQADNSILDQIRSKYKESAVKYGLKFFSLEDLEERIQFMRTNNTPLDAFISQEIEFHRTLKAKAEQMQADLKSKEEVHRKVEEIMAANDALIEQYPDNFFDPRASFEIRRLCGAITQAYPLIEYIVTYIGRGGQLWSQQKGALTDLEWFFVPQGRRPAGFLRQYGDVLALRDVHKIEQTERQLMQTAAMALLKLSNLIDQELATMTENSKRQKISVTGLYDENLKEQMRTKSVGEAADMVAQSLRQIISDFRLGDLAQYAANRNGGAQ